MLCEEFDVPIKTGLRGKKVKFLGYAIYIFVLTLIAAALGGRFCLKRNLSWEKKEKMNKLHAEGGICILSVFYSGQYPH